MIAFGSSIGTGLFIASGTVISQIGFGSAILLYTLIGIMVYFLMTSLSELVYHMPVSGSFAIYGQKYVEEGFGFALGWNYWYNWSITIATDLVAVQLVMSYWFPNNPNWIWSIFLLVLIFFFNYLSVSSFGEAEYWFSIIKIIAILVFIFIGIFLLIKIFRSTEIIILNEFILNDSLFIGKLSTVFHGSIIVGFSFQGIELISIAFGECKYLKRNIHQVICRTVWYVLLLYIFTILITSLIIPYKDLNFLKNGNKYIISPFILIFKYAGLHFLDSIMNIVILIVILSSGNSGMYASTRMLFSLASNGKAPRIFASLSKRGVPINALYATTAVAGICFLTSIVNNKTIYLWLLNISGTTGFIAWIGIVISHYRFRRGYIIQGYNVNDLPYSKFFPSNTIFTSILCLVLIIGESYEIINYTSVRSWSCTLATCISILLFLIIWLSYKLINGTKLIDYKEMKFF